MTATVGDTSSLRAPATSRPNRVIQVFSVGSASVQKRISRLLSIATDLHVEEVSREPNFYLVTACANADRARAIWAFVTVVDPAAHLDKQVDDTGAMEPLANLNLETSGERIPPNAKDHPKLVRAEEN